MIQYYYRKNIGRRGFTDRLSHIFIPKRLYQQLKSIYDEKLTIISAPDGCGKTTTVGEFIKRSRPDGISCRTITDNLSADDCFVKYCRLTLGIEEHIPVTQKEYTRLCRIFSSAQPKKKMLVLLDSPAAEKMILYNMYCARLLSQYAPAATAVLCSEISYRHERGMKYYYISGITPEDFRLTPHEISEYFASCGVKCVDADTIHTMTGGEILRVRLCMLMHINNIPVTNYRCDRLITDALIRRLTVEVQFAGLCAAVFHKLDDAVFADLAERSILSTYFGEAAVNSDNIKNGIEEINRVVPLIRVNKKTGSHSPHPIFRLAMNRYFLELPKEVRQALHYCSALEYVREKKSFRAFCQLYLAGDYYAAAAVEKKEIVSFELLMRNKELLFKFALECPLDCKPIVPIFLRILALLMLTTYKERVKHRFDDAIAYITDSDSYAESERRNLLSYAHALKTYGDFYIIEKMGNHIKRAYDLYYGKKIFSPPFYSWTVYTPSVFCLIHRYSVPIATEAEQFARYHRMYTEMIRHGEYIVELYNAEALYYTGDYKSCLALSLETIQSCTRELHLPTRMIALCTASRCALLLGDYEIYKASSDEIAHIMRKYSTTEIGEMAELCLALLCCMKTGGTEDIWPVCAAPDSEVLLNRYTAPFYFFVRSFAMLSHKEYKLLLSKKDYYLQAAKDVRNESVYLMLMMSVATAHYLLGETEDAAKAMLYVAETLEDSGIITPAAELCVHFPQIFDFAQTELSEKHLTFFRRVNEAAKPIRKNVELLRTYELTEIGSEEKSKRTITASFEADTDSLEETRKQLGLTKKAMKYALLAAQRLSNNEIAELCGTTPDSVKSSLKRTFAALGIRSRGQLYHIFNLQ